MLDLWIELSYMKFLVLLFAFFSLGLVSQEARACRCAPKVWDQLAKDPTQAPLITLLKVPPSANSDSKPVIPKTTSLRQLRLELMPYKRGAPQFWKETGSSCDLRWQEDVWYVLVSQVQSDEQPILCNSWARPVAEATDWIGGLEKAWDKNLLQANPHWSLGCQKDSDCVVDEGLACLPSFAIRPQFKTALQKWRKEQEPRLNCERGPAPVRRFAKSVRGKPADPQQSARCHTGVCELVVR
jgi:hypothetical protein